MRMIANLDCENLAGPQTLERTTLITSAQGLDLPEAAENLALSVENCGSIPPPKQGLGPRLKEWIFGFRHLRHLTFAATFPALFPL